MESWGYGDVGLWGHGAYGVVGNQSLWGHGDVRTLGTVGTMGMWGYGIMGI